MDRFADFRLFTVILVYHVGDVVPVEIAQWQSSRCMLFYIPSVARDMQTFSKWWAINIYALPLWPHSYIMTHHNTVS